MVVVALDGKSRWRPRVLDDTQLHRALDPVVPPDDRSILTPDVHRVCERRELL